MRNLHKLLLPAIVLGLPFFLMASCQSVSANDSSVIEQTAEEVEMAVCIDLAPDTMTSIEFASLSEFAQEYVAVIWAAWDARCGEA